MVNMSGETIGNSAEEYKELDPAIIRAELDEPKDVADLPAIDILEEQLNRNYEEINRTSPQLSIREKTFKLVEDFSNDDAYGLVINQPRYMPPAFDNEMLDLHNRKDTIKEIEIGRKKLQKERSQNHMIENDGWLWVSGEMNNEEEIERYNNNVKYRIYLSPNPKDIGSMLYEIGSTIPSNIQYRMKTFDSDPNRKDLQRGDKIVMYCTEGNFTTIVNSLSEVLREKNYLTDRPVPGGGTCSPMEGISFAKEVKGTSASEIIAQETTKRLAETSWRELDRYFTSKGRKEDILKSPGWEVWQIFSEQEKEEMLRVLEEDSWGAFNKILKDSDEKSKEIFQDLFFYATTARLHEKLSPLLGKDEKYINDFLDKEQFVNKFGQGTIDRLKMFINKPNEKLQKSMNNIAIKTVLAMKISNAISKGQKPGTGLRSVLAK